MSRPRTLARGLAGVALGLLLGACGGGSSPTAPSGSISFTPDRAAGNASVTLRRGPGTTATHLQLELVATQLTGVHDVSIVLGVPEVLRYVGQSQGTFLTSDGGFAALTAAQLPAPFQGVLVADVRANGAAGVSGSGVLFTLELDALAAGSGRVTLNGPEARDAGNRAIPGIDWISGTVTVVR